MFSAMIAAERADGIPGERLAVGVEPVVAEGGAARVVVLDDDAGGAFVAELGEDGARAVEVEDVVERELLAVQLADAREHAAARADLRVEGGSLVRVLAVREVHRLLVGAGEEVREVLAALGEPAGDRGVVAGGVRERLGRERLAGLGRELPAGARQLLDHRVVGLGARDDGGEPVVLGGRPDHRGAADVDVLDGVGVGHAGARDGALERVEVHADEVDELDVVLGGLRHVLGVVAQREQPGVEPRVQRLDAAVHDLREAGEVVDGADVEARIAQRGRGAAGRDELHAEADEAASEVHDAGLVGDGEQGPAHPDVAGPGERLVGGGCLLGDGARLLNASAVSRLAIRGRRWDDESPRLEVRAMTDEQHPRDAAKPAADDVAADMERRLEQLGEDVHDAERKAAAPRRTR